MTATEVVTPRLRSTAKRAAFWIVGGVVLLVIAVVALATLGGAQERAPLDPQNAAPAGGMAVAEVLRQQGVDVIPTSSLEDTRDAIDSPAQTTLFLYDAGLYLTDEKLREAVDLADTVIIAEPGFTELQAVAPGVAQAGTVAGPIDADCDLGAVQRAGVISGEAQGYRLIDEKSDALLCLGSGDGVYSLVGLEDDGRRLFVLGATAPLTNELAIADGNAAFALGLLGENETLVWYLPSFADVESTESIGELTPGWVGPLMVLLALVFVAAAIWRGRRLGPLVIEGLPVVVRSSETMLGRARLYQKSSARLRALDALRVGTVQRLAALCGLPSTATVDDVIVAVSALTGAQPNAVRSLLVDADPASDRDLIDYSDALLTLERDVAARIRP
ncbi:DUF4350 domain-containing protein [Schumannella luteola]